MIGAYKKVNKNIFLSVQKAVFLVSNNFHWIPQKLKLIYEGPCWSQIFKKECNLLWQKLKSMEMWTPQRSPRVYHWIPRGFKFPLILIFLRVNDKIVPRFRLKNGPNLNNIIFSADIALYRRLSRIMNPFIINNKLTIVVNTCGLKW